jgi:cell division protease FtsH
VLYSDVIAKFDNLEVDKYKLDLGSGKLTYTVRGDEKVQTYTVPNVNIFLNDINGGYTQDGRYASYRVRYNEVNMVPLKEDYVPISDNTFLTTLLPYLLLIGAGVATIVFLAKRSIRKRKAKKNSENQN